MIGWVFWRSWWNLSLAHQTISLASAPNWMEILYTTKPRLENDNHLLFELAYVFYRIRSTIIHGERWLMEVSGKFCPFYSLCKGWLRDLAQCLFHNIFPYTTLFRSMSKVMREPCNERLMIWKSNSVGQNRSSTLLTLMSLQMMKRILYTGNALELHQANLSPGRMSIFTKRNAGALLTKE